jgi:probable HAF family extracellular repeat protein
MNLRCTSWILATRAALALLLLTVPATITAQSYSVIDLGHLGGNVSLARGINNNGQVVGYSFTGAVDKYGNGVYHGFRWDSTNGMVDVGTLKSDLNSSVGGINDSGTMAGASSTAPVQEIAKKTGRIYYVQTDHAVTWSSGPSIKKLATSQAWGINASGLVVGYTIGDAPEVDHAWVWVPSQPNGTSDQLTDLDSLIPAGSGWVLNRATGINDAGQVVGTGTINGVSHGFLLTPE